MCNIFLGIVLYEVTAMLGIATSKLINTKYGSPILPVIKLSKPLSSKDKIPSSRHICAAISVTFRSVTVPEIQKSVSTLLARWSEIQDKGSSSIRQIAPEAIWPEVVLEEDPGKICFS